MNLYNIYMYKLHIIQYITKISYLRLFLFHRVQSYDQYVPFPAVRKFILTLIVLGIKTPYGFFWMGGGNTLFVSFDPLTGQKSIFFYLN